MSLGSDELRGMMVSHLRDCGIGAVSAWGGDDRQFDGQPLVAVSLRNCATGESGFANYLGEQWNEGLQCWEEIYARKVALTFGLDLYGPVELGEAAILAVFDQIVVALTEQKISGMNLEEVSCGETEYDQGERLLKRRVEVGVTMYLYAVAGAGATFLDFKVKGGLLK